MAVQGVLCGFLGFFLNHIANELPVLEVFAGLSVNQVKKRDLATRMQGPIAGVMEHTGKLL